MKKSEDKSKWMLAPIDSNNVELNNFDWLDGEFDIMHHKNRHAIYVETGLIEMVEQSENLLITNVSASKADWLKLADRICEEINNCEENENLYAEFEDFTDANNNVGFITFFWT